MKRILSLLLAVVIATGMFSMVEFAVQAEEETPAGVKFTAKEDFWYGYINTEKGVLSKNDIVDGYITAKYTVYNPSEIGMWIGFGYHAICWWGDGQATWDGNLETYTRTYLAPGEVETVEFRISVAKDNTITVVRDIYGEETQNIDISQFFFRVDGGGRTPSVEAGSSIVFIEENTSSPVYKLVGKNSSQWAVSVEENKKISGNCSVKVVNSVTKKPIVDAKLYVENGKTYFADKDGLINIDLASISNNVYRKITVSSDFGDYEPYSSYLGSLNLYGQNIIELQSANSDLSFAGFSAQKVTVDGPTIKFLGEEIPMFSLDIGLDLASIPGLEKIKYLDEANNIRIDKVKKTISIMIGVGDGYSVDADADWYEDFDKFKDYYKSYHSNASWKEVSNKYNKIREKLRKIDTEIAFDCSATYCGYIEIDYSTGVYKIKESGVVLNFEAAVQKDVPLGTWFYATFKLAGEANGKMLFQMDDTGTINGALNMAFSFKPSLGIGAKLISKKVASAEIGIEGKITTEISVPAASLEEALKIMVSANAYVRFNVLMLQIKATTKWGGVQLYPKNTNTYAISRLAMEDETDTEMQSIPRDYLNPYAIGLMSMDDGTLNETGVYPYSKVDLIALNNGNIVALWIKDDGTKTDNNRTTLYYSMYSNGVWSVPVAVYESGKADFAPKATTDGEKIHIVWQRASRIFEDDTELSEMLSCTELVYSEFSDGIFSEPVVITDNTEEYQLLYSIANENDATVISWVENSENDYTQTTGMNSVYERVCENGIWGDSKVISCDTGNVESLATGFYNGTACTIYSESFDDADYEVYIDGEQITDDDAQDESVSCQNGKIYWKKDGVLCYYEDNQVISTELSVEDDEYVVISEGVNDSLVFRKNDGFKNELYISYKNDGGYTTPVALTEYEKHISDFDIVSVEGKLVSLLITDNISEEGEFPFTTTDMICDIYEGKNDLAINEYVSYDEAMLVCGENVPFVVSVENKGTNVVDNYMIKIQDTDGVTLCEKTFDNSINPGEKIENMIEYTVPENFSRCELTFVVSAPNDNNPDNNSCSLSIGKTDIEVVNCNIEEGFIKGIVINNGFDVAENVTVEIEVMDNERKTLYSKQVGTLNVDESQEFEFEIPKEHTNYSDFYESTRYIISSSTTSVESNYTNNDCDVLHSPIRVAGISLDKSNANICLKEEVCLTAKVVPSDAFDTGVIWLSDSTEVAVVDQNGKVTAISAGTAIITAITKDGEFVASCIVNVLIPDAGTIVGATVDIGYTLTINYYVDMVDGYSNSVMRFTSSGGSVKEAEGVFDNATGLYKYSYTGINPQCMNDEIKAELLLGDEVIDIKEGYSIKVYCENQMARTAEELGITNTQHEYLKKLLADMLIYGGEAQKYKNYNVEALPDTSDWVQKYKRDFAVPSGVKKVYGNEDEQNKIKSVGLRMANVNKIYFKFMVSDEDIVVLLNDEVVDISTLEIEEGLYKLYTDGIMASQFSDVFTLKLVKDGEEISKVEYNVDAYVQSKYETSTVGDIVKALNNYGKSAKLYLGSFIDGDFSLGEEDIL